MKYENLNKFEKFANDFYVEYANDFLTIDYMAEYYSITPSLCNVIIDYGRSVNHMLN